MKHRRPLLLMLLLLMLLLLLLLIWNRAGNLALLVKLSARVK